MLIQIALSAWIGLIVAKRTATFSAMHERRAKAIETLYSLFVDAEDRAENALDPRNTIAEAVERTEAAYEAMRVLKHFYDRHRIYLSPALSDRAAKLLEAIRSPVHMASMYVENPLRHEVDKREEHTARVQEWQSFRQKVGELRPILETEFRTVIGSASTPRIRVSR